MEFLIRKACEKDIDEVFAMAQRLAEMQNLLPRFCLTPAILKEMIQEAHPTTHTIVITQQETIMGFAMYTLLKNNRLYHHGFAMYVDELFIQPAYRGKGLGTELFKYIAKIATQSDCNRMEWWVEKDNKDAVVFYEKMGARALDEFITFRLLEPALGKFAHRGSDVIN